MNMTELLRLFIEVLRHQDSWFLDVVRIESSFNEFDFSSLLHGILQGPARDWSPQLSMVTCDGWCFCSSIKMRSCAIKEDAWFSRYQAGLSHRVISLLWKVSLWVMYACCHTPDLVITVVLTMQHQSCKESCHEILTASVALTRFLQGSPWCSAQWWMIHRRHPRRCRLLGIIWGWQCYFKLYSTDIHPHPRPPDSWELISHGHTDTLLRCYFAAKVHQFSRRLLCSYALQPAAFVAHQLAHKRNAQRRQSVRCDLAPVGPALVDEKTCGHTAGNTSNHERSGALGFCNLYWF